MPGTDLITIINNKQPNFKAIAVTIPYADEIVIQVKAEDFRKVCLVLHESLSSPVMAFFAVDDRQKQAKFTIYCYFLNIPQGQWVAVSLDIPSVDPYFDSLAKDIYSAHLFEREIWEMFGLEPRGNPDLRRLRLHDEVWPTGNYPLRKDFREIIAGEKKDYKFARVEGEGIFEVPVGPVHAGIIGPGHFRFSVAGEPIIHLESRLGFTHRGVEKLFEGKSLAAGLLLAECVSGDSVIAHSLAYSLAAEKIAGITIGKKTAYCRAIVLELERMYNHVNDIGGIALDVGFSFPAALAAIIKESILQANEKLTGSRYLKGMNKLGGISLEMNPEQQEELTAALSKIKEDFTALVEILDNSVSFVDRVDGTGTLKMEIAEDLGVLGLAGRAAGVKIDLRKHFPSLYHEAKHKIITGRAGDVLARLKVRIEEFNESGRLIAEFLNKISSAETEDSKINPVSGKALGYSEGWRGPVLYWLKTNPAGIIERCKITDPSFHNWPGLSYAVIGEIIPDFPLCNKSFDLSYAGNDL
ncbi:MAG: NADH-quinone oxidoreductase subunit C [bacterium]|nr:NADH-quinone oxidoreductase subunit C [bacterium]